MMMCKSVHVAVNIVYKLQFFLHLQNTIVYSNHERSERRKQAANATRKWRDSHRLAPV